MVDALKESSTITSEGVTLHQLLHGYSQGHRLLQSSLQIPDDISRLLLRMSDLSGSDVAKGFEDYLTGYPLPTLDAYALGMTWYAPEMPRPGCVWTHTLLIPAAAMCRIPNLGVLESVFRRPSQSDPRELYRKQVPLPPVPEVGTAISENGNTAIMLSNLLFHFYGNQNKPLLLPAQNSHEFKDALFAMWSQQWPSLRMQFTFCTGSLSSRSYDKRPLDVQCVPVALVREVAREVPSSSIARPDIFSPANVVVDSWVHAAAKDARCLGGGDLRDFLWAVADSDDGRGDFASLVSAFDAVRESQSLPVDLIATLFPAQSSGRGLKELFFGRFNNIRDLRQYEEQDILSALATTSRYASFDAATLLVRQRGIDLCTTRPHDAGRLISELCRATLNPIGEEILNGLISAADANIVGDVADEHPELLPTLFGSNPRFATFARLWVKGGDRRRELFESVASNEGLDASLIHDVIDAMLTSGADGLIWRALERWNKEAVFSVLRWGNTHRGALSETCLQALKSYVPSVMDWVGANTDATPECLVSIAHVVAPCSHDVARYDSTVWLRVFRSIRNSSDESETTYLSAFLLALAYENAPPAPLALVSESFECLHEVARLNALGDDAWMIVEPLVPELSWYANWDKCERLRRALISAFIHHKWPVAEFKMIIKNREVRRQLLKSARKINGGEDYFSNLHTSD